MTNKTKSLGQETHCLTAKTAKLYDQFWLGSVFHCTYETENRYFLPKVKTLSRRIVLLSAMAKIVQEESDLWRSALKNASY